MIHPGVIHRFALRCTPYRLTRGLLFTLRLETSCQNPGGFIARSLKSLCTIGGIGLLAVDGRGRLAKGGTWQVNGSSTSRSLGQVADCNKEGRFYNDVAFDLVFFSKDPARSLRGVSAFQHWINWSWTSTTRASLNGLILEWARNRRRRLQWGWWKKFYRGGGPYKSDELRLLFIVEKSISRVQLKKNNINQSKVK